MNKSEFDISNLRKCLDSLKKSITDYNNINDINMKEYIRDSYIKRYEYTIETAWKLMKRYLKEEYGKNNRELTMNNIFRLMEGYGFIISWEKWREYYDRRNDTSHEYNEGKSQIVLQEIEKFISDCDFFYEELEKAVKLQNSNYRF